MEAEASKSLTALVIMELDRLRILLVPNGLKTTIGFV
jgi:hypothetical protein